jgi:hypothetical protein
MVEPSDGYHGLKFWETFDPITFAIRTRVEVLRDKPTPGSPRPLSPKLLLPPTNHPSQPLLLPSHPIPSHHLLDSNLPYPNDVIRLTPSVNSINLFTTPGPHAAMIKELTPPPKPQRPPASSISNSRGSLPWLPNLLHPPRHLHSRKPHAQFREWAVTEPRRPTNQAFSIVDGDAQSW